MSIIPTTIKSKKLVKKRREQIVLAAIELFSQKGFHKTTLRDLSEKSNISYGNIYDYVGSKQDIFYLIHEYLRDIAFCRLTELVNSVRHPLERLRRMIRAEFKLMDEWSDGLLLLYQEGHVLKQPYKGWFLKKEHEHVQLFEQAISECVSQGLLDECNPRLLANLIKTMVDSWTLKRWDLEGKATASEAENCILKALLQGFRTSVDLSKKSIGELAGRKALVVGSGIILETACCEALDREGAEVVLYHRNTDEYDRGEAKPAPRANIAVYAAQDYGDLDENLLRQIQQEYGPFDIFVQNLGIGYCEGGAPTANNCGRLLRTTLEKAEDITAWLSREIPKSTWGRIIYLAPWAWDQQSNTIAWGSARAGAKALTAEMAKCLTAKGVNVNCVMPGYIRTSMHSTSKKWNFSELSPARIGEVSDVAETVLFFCGDKSRQLSNQVIGIAEDPV
jgi:NAD(P)-dependent dehydrogenase (short-subunit alcohol dehydrogenase family)/AcrR family transcriptional regulator